MCEHPRIAVDPDSLRVSLYEKSARPLRFELQQEKSAICLSCGEQFKVWFGDAGRGRWHPVPGKDPNLYEIAREG